MLYFLHSTSVLSFYIDVVLTLSTVTCISRHQLVNIETGRCYRLRAVRANLSLNPVNLSLYVLWLYTQLVTPSTPKNLSFWIVYGQHSVPVYRTQVLKIRVAQQLHFHRTTRGSRCLKVKTISQTCHKSDVLEEQNHKCYSVAKDSEGKTFTGYCTPSENYTVSSKLERRYLDNQTV